MQLSIIILTWNSERDVQPCINSLLAATAHLNCEIIVVDNGSTDSTLSLLAEYDVIQVIPQDTNLGVAKARNIGLRRAKGEYIWILDVDTIVNADAVNGMLHYMTSHSECGVCGSALVSADGIVQDSARKLPYPWFKALNVLEGKTNGISFLRGLNRSIKRVNSHQFYRKAIQGYLPFSPAYIIGACQMIRSSVIERVGLLDEHIFYGPEDADFCNRVSHAGYSVVCLPQYKIVHHYMRITRKSLFSPMALLHTKALLYFYAKLLLNRK